MSSKNKTLRKNLKTEAQILFDNVMQYMPQKTINKYGDLIRYTEHISSLRKIVRELSLLNEAREQHIDDEKPVKLTSQTIKQVRKEKRMNELSNQSFKSKEVIRKTTRGQILSGVNGIFKESYVYADELDVAYEVSTYKKIEDVEDRFKNSPIMKLLSYKIQNELNEVNNKKHKSTLKVYLTIKTQMKKKVGINKKTGEILYQYKEHFYNSAIKDILSTNNIGVFLNDCFQEYLEALREGVGSDWVFDKFLNFKIGSHFSKSQLGKSYIKLPDVIANKKACVNIKNKDNKCFDYCLVASKIYDTFNAKDKNEVYHYKKHMDKIVVPSDIEYPVAVDDIPEYEELNNMQINVFKLVGLTNETEDFKKCIEQVYKSNQHRKEVVNLLLIDDSNGNSHYVLINQLSRLFAMTSSKHTKYICPHCLVKSCRDGDELEKHVIKCANYSEADKIDCDVNVECPKEGSTLKFIHDDYSFKHPFHIIADFESTLMSVEDSRECSTKRYQKHLQNSFGLKYCSIHPEHDKDVEIFNSSNPDEVSKQFIERIEDLALESYKLITKNKKHNLQSDKFVQSEMMCAQKSNICKTCNNQCNEKNEMVIHHDHITGKFISIMCNQCNLKLKYKRVLPVYIHNLKGYDAHLFVKSLHTYGQTDVDVECIPNNEERYISFSKVIKVGEYFCKKDKVIKPITFEIRFLDSIAFMNSSIESLVENLKTGCKTIHELRVAFPNTSKHFTDDNQMELMTQKGVYPYDFIDTYDKMNMNSLPPRNAFYSKLYGSECSLKDYSQAKTVWKAFNCEKFLDYHNLYLKSDVLLLADVWASFRETCFKNYQLDCTYYYTAPGLSFDAMLKHTKIELELLSDVEMYEFVERGIRGGLSQVSTRHAVANNKYMKMYDKTKDDSYIIYLDANALYAWAMSQYMPVSGFKWNSDTWTTEKIMDISNNADIGYMFEVDLSIPQTILKKDVNGNENEINLHDLFNNYVPLPVNTQVKKENLNKWQQEDYKKSKIRKLCCTFEDRKNYVINYRMLKMALSLGFKLDKVHRVLQFNQKPFLKSYIDLNTDLRKVAKNEFEKDFFKLMNNSVFGKTMENVRNRINFKLISTEDQAWRVKNLKRFTIFSENLVGVHTQKKEIKLIKPVYLGQTILDDSKYLMVNFHYNKMLGSYGIKRENIDLLFTDTDSLCYHIRHQDIFEIMGKNQDDFDNSEYPQDHFLYNPKNKKVAGVFKNESPASQITEIVCLRAKLYAYETEKDSKHIKCTGNKCTHDRNKCKVSKCKGIKKCVVNKDLNIDLYRDVLFNRSTHNVNQNGIRSYGHELFTETINKTALSATDDKVFICDNNIHTYNFGHYKTK
jgi:hypothetical protein